MEQESSLIHIAAEKGDLDKVKYFLGQGVSIDFRSGLNRTPLHYAAMRGHFEVVEFLINNECDLNAKENDGDTPLLLAVHMRHFEIFELLVNRGADINCSNRGKETLLHKACQHGLLSVVRFLVNKKCDLNAQTIEGETPIVVAASCWRKHVVQFLVDSGACLMSFDACYGQTVLHHASGKGWPGVVRAILERNEVDLELKNRGGSTPLLLAARNIRREIFDLLLESGANLNCQDRGNRSVLHYAAEWGWPDVVKKCTEVYPNLSVQNDFCMTPLTIACRSKRTDIVKLLLDAGADCNVKNKWNGTALTLTIDFGIQVVDVFKLLIENGAFLEGSDHAVVQKSSFFKEHILTDV